MNITEETAKGEDFILKANSELRFEVEGKSKVYVTLHSGFAELFGTELVKKKKYEFLTGAKVAIFTFKGCLLNISGKSYARYISEETPMVQYYNCHTALEQMRILAEEKDGRGPIIMVVGPKDVGKSTLCRIFLNYAVRLGRRPLYVDIDVGQGAISIPGTFATKVIERPASIEEGFSHTAPLAYHFGHSSPSGNSALYVAAVSKMAEKTLKSMNVNKRIKHSGIVINTCGWVIGGGYNILLHTVQAFEVNAIFVLDQERLYNELLRDIPSFVKLVLLPKSDGVVKRSTRLRKVTRALRINEYFYGLYTPLYPFSFEVKFADIKLYKIGVRQFPLSCVPIGMKAVDHQTKLVAVTPSTDLLHHILSVSSAKTIEEDLIGTNIVGIVCVTDVDMDRQTIMILSLQPRPLPGTILLLSELQFIDSHA